MFKIISLFLGVALDYFHDNKLFSTYDHENDEDVGYNCADVRNSGWWYYGCYSFDLNGDYSQYASLGYEHVLESYDRFHYTQMMIRPGMA